MKIFALQVTALALCSLSFAGTISAASDDNQPQATAARQKVEAMRELPRSVQATTQCSFNFKSGAGETGLAYCVTANGNIPSIETPELHQNVSAGLAEGYGICDENTEVAYSDFAGAGDSGNWGPATVLSHSATSVKIARTTSDGIWTLTQTVTQVAGNSPFIKIAMTLRNNTNAPRLALLVRYVDADIDGVTSNNFDATRTGASGWNSVSIPNSSDQAIGLILEDIGPAFFARQGFVQNVPSPPNPCNPFAAFPAAPLLSIDGSLNLAYRVQVGGRSAATATMMYRGW